MMNSTRTFLSVLILSTTFSITCMAAGRQFYQIRVYHLKTVAQEEKVDAFLKDAYLPALHRAGIPNVGVFKLLAGSPQNASVAGEKLTYVFVPVKSYVAFSKLEQKLLKDKKYHEQGKSYLEAVYTEPPYERIETILLNAFDAQPNFDVPPFTSPKKDRIYELRSYEGHTENISRNKIRMFNEGGEVELFKSLGFNAVFYGEVVAGGRMPNLMYMTTFQNKAARDEHWAAFSASPVWKKLSALPEYQHNVSKNVTLFLYPADYSDI